MGRSPIQGAMSLQSYIVRNRLRKVIRFIGLGVAVLSGYIILVSLLSDEEALQKLPAKAAVPFVVGTVAFIISFFLPKLPRYQKTVYGGREICAGCNTVLKPLKRTEIYITHGRMYCDLCAKRLAEGSLTTPFQDPNAPKKREQTTLSSSAASAAQSRSAVQFRLNELHVTATGEIVPNLPDGLEFNPNEIDLRVKDARRDFLFAQFFGKSDAELSGIAQNDARLDHLSFTELILLMEQESVLLEQLRNENAASARIIDMRLSRMTLRGRIVDRLIRTECYVIVRNSLNVPIPVRDRTHIAIYTLRVKAEAVAQLLNRSCGAELHSVMTIPYRQLAPAAERWLVQGYSSFNIDGQPHVFRLTEVGAPPSGLPRNPELCRKILAYHFTYYTGRDDVFFKPEDIDAARADIIASVKNASFLALKDPQPLTRADGTTAPDYLRAVLCSENGLTFRLLALWTDQYAMKTYLSSPERKAYESEVTRIDYAEVLARLTDHPSEPDYAGIAISLGTFMYRIPAAALIGTQNAPASAQKTRSDADLIKGSLPNGVQYIVRRQSDHRFYLDLHDLSGNTIADAFWMPGQAGIAIFRLTEDEYAMAAASDGKDADPAFIEFAQKLLEQYPKDRLEESFYFNVVTKEKSPFRPESPAETIDDFKYRKWETEHAPSAQD